MFTNRKRLIVFAIIFIILIVTPIALNRYYHFMLGPVSQNQQEPSQIFVVKPGEPLTDIAANLQKERLIKNAFAFRMLVGRMGIAKNIQAGDFRLSAAMSARQIARELTHGVIDVWVTLLEGERVEEQAAKIEKELKFAANDVYQFDKGEYIKIAEEGYMFPDTYLVPKDANAKQIAQKLRDTFDQNAADSLPQKGQNSTLTAQKVVILASIIEREAKTNDEKPTIAGILLNRLTAGMPLQVDATVQYAKGYNMTQKTWWPQVTTDDYKSVKSQYNTYLNPGLPPGPISNPGLSSIEAAANPKDTDYLYYLHDPQGNIHFAKTTQEHNQNIQQFLLAQ